MAKSVTQVAVFVGSRLVSVYEGSPSIAWRAAVTEVKTRARAFEAGLYGFFEGGHWYRTANRDGFAISDIRCTQLRARSST